MSSASIPLDRLQRLLSDTKQELEQLKAQPASSSKQSCLVVSLSNLKRSLQEAERAASLEISVAFRLAAIDAIKSARESVSCLQREFDAIKAQSKAPAPTAKASEQSLDYSINRLDETIEIANQSLFGLQMQRGLIKTANKKLTDALHSLGFSNSTIRQVRRHMSADRLIFACGLFTLLVVFAVLFRYCR